jgi:hypothetical protein
MFRSSLLSGLSSFSTLAFPPVFLNPISRVGVSFSRLPYLMFPSEVWKRINRSKLGDAILGSVVEKKRMFCVRNEAIDVRGYRNVDEREQNIFLVDLANMDKDGLYAVMPCLRSTSTRCGTAPRQSAAGSTAASASSTPVDMWEFAMAENIGEPSIFRTDGKSLCAFFLQMYIRICSRS